MNLGQFAVSRPIAVIMRVAALVLLGYICLLRLPVDLLPKVDIPTVVVNVSWPNTGPEEMESEIARPIEEALSTVKGLDILTTTTGLGTAFVRVQFQYGVDIDSASVEVMQLVARATAAFPTDPNISTPQIFKFDPSTLPILIYGVSSSDGDLTKLRTRLTNEISPRLESAGGVASVTVGGGSPRAILVDVDTEKMRAHRVTFSQISSRLAQENISLPAGIAREGKTQYNIRAVGYVTSLDQIRKLPVTSVNGSQVMIGDLATVKDASRDLTTFVRVNGKPAVSMSVTKQSNTNTIDVAAGIQSVLSDVERANPDLQFSTAYDQAGFISNSINDLKQTAVFGAVLAIVIITFFLRNLRSTFVVSLSIPISIVSTFALFYFGGFTLNAISLSGLALATGLIVDDAIVVLENIYRHIEQRRCSPREAAVTGTNEILSAVFASTFTVMIVFLPLLLIKGQAGQVFTQFALVVVFSMSVSILDALTVVPMLASRMVRVQDAMDEVHPEERRGRGARVTLLTKFYDWSGVKLRGLETGYRLGLAWALRHRLAIVGVGVASIVVALLLWPQVGQESLPETDSGNISVNLKLPIGTPVATTDQVMKRIESVALADPDVDTVLAAAGGNVGLRGAGSGAPQQGSATIMLKSKRKSKTKAVVQRLQAKTKGIVGATIQISSLDLVSRILGNNQGFSIDVYGSDLPTLTTVARQVQQAMSNVSGLQNPDLSIQDALPELDWKVDRAKAKALGVSFQDAASVIAAATNGQLSTYYQEKGFQYPIYVQFPHPSTIDTQSLKNLPVAYLTNGDTITLGQVASPVYSIGPNQITRQNRQRVITVSGNVVDRPVSAVQSDTMAALAKLGLPQGVYYKLGYQQSQAAKQFQGLGVSVLLAIALIYMLLATQFESLIDPLVILVSVPLCTIGLVLALFLTDRAFGLTAFIGLLMLVGIAVKNGILLVNYTTQLRHAGMKRDEALFKAGPTRLRPILMTSLAAVFGMLPLALGLGSGSEMYVPLATVVIGGLMTSTLLTLFIVPVVYTIFDDLKMRFAPHLALSHDQPSDDHQPVTSESIHPDNSPFGL